jgi:hypothetical protein
VNDPSLYPSPFSSPRPLLPPAPHALRERHPHIVALMLIFGLIPGITFAALFWVAAVNHWYNLGFALPPGAFVFWHLLLAYGTWHGWRWAWRVARVWVRLSFHLTIMAAIALAPTGVGIVLSLALLLIVGVAAVVALAARR